MANDLIDLESFCGFCNTRVGASLEERRKHMFGCRKHPAYELGKRYQAIAEALIAFQGGRGDEVDCLARIQKIVERE